MAITKLMGQNFRIFKDGSAIPEAKNCTVTIQGNMEDDSTKDSTGTWTEDTMVSKQWQVQVEDVDASLASLRGLFTLFNDDAGCVIGFDRTAGNQNRAAQNASFASSGSAILTDLSISANNRQTIQVTCQYQGTGPLE